MRYLLWGECGDGCWVRGMPGARLRALVPVAAVSPDRRAPKVTVGLPVFNGENYVREALSSLLAQDFGDFELLVADNASTDLTLDICREAADRDPRVTVLTSDHNRGAAWNYCRLVWAASGEYFRWASHDDVNHSRLLGSAVDVLDADPAVSLVYWRMQLIDQRGEVIAVAPSAAMAEEGRAPARARTFFATKRLPHAAPFGLVRRRQMLGTSLIKPYKASDRTLLLELALRGRWFEVPESLFHHRRHADRSVRIPLVQRQAWWDGGTGAPLRRPRWRLLAEHVRAVNDAPLSRRERAECLAYVGLWLGNNAVALAREGLAPADHPKEEATR